jgi:hypothetical protein
MLCNAALGALVLGGCAGGVRAQQSAAAAMPAPVTADGFTTEDPLFQQPYVDVQEWRDAPVRHFYVHGGFTGTDTRFSYYFPEAAAYEGRFFQHVTPVPDSENLAQAVPAGEDNKIGFATASGAYFVETNGGGQMDIVGGTAALADPTITAFRANAAAAQFSRHVAAQVFPGSGRPYGYIFGGSGGGFRTVGSLENTQGVWDGGVPYVLGSTMAIPNMFTVRMQALRVLRDKFPGIVDAMEVGGSGNPYAGLTEHEASVLREIEVMGFPMKTWFSWRTMGLHGLAALYGGIYAADTAYFTDFWTKPGYLGFDHPELFTADRVQVASTVLAPITAREAHDAGLLAPEGAEANGNNVDTAFLGSAEDARRIVGFRLAAPVPHTYFLGGELLVSSGAGAGKRIALDSIRGDVVLLGVTRPAEVALLAAGDAVTVDNSNFLAMETYHRHQVPGPDFAVWDAFRNADGTPVYPQRPFLIGPMFVRGASGSMMTGEVDEKVIIAESLWDREAMPWQGDWYRQRLAGYHGGDDAGNVRLYYTDHAVHGDSSPGAIGEDANRIVSYVPVLHQALRHLAAWVEDGTPPPASSRYRIEDGQVLLAPTAEARMGLQPLVTLTANGGERADVRVGQAVRLEGAISAPAGAGSIVTAEWDFTGEGAFTAQSPVGTGSSAVRVTMDHRFTAPGTYYVALRGVSHRDGDAATPYARIANLGRVRVVVSE